MDLTLILYGALIGIAVAAPLGPVNVLVIRSCLRRGTKGGMAAGSGSLLADGLFSVLAAYGLASFQHFADGYAQEIRIGGGLLLILMGARMALTHAPSVDQALKVQKSDGMSLWRKFLLGFAMTISNPGAFLGVLALFTALSEKLRLEETPARPALAILGIIVGGLFWWLMVSLLLNYLRAWLTPKVLDIANRLAGTIIAAFGAALLLGLR